MSACQPLGAGFGGRDRKVIALGLLTLHPCRCVAASTPFNDVTGIGASHRPDDEDGTVTLIHPKPPGSTAPKPSAFHRDDSTIRPDGRPLARREWNAQTADAGTSFACPTGSPQSRERADRVSPSRYPRVKVIENTRRAWVGSPASVAFESLATVYIRVPAQAAEASIARLRTRNGDHEVDLVVVRDDGRVLAIAGMLASTVEDRDTKHLRRLAAHRGDRLLDAIVINTGPAAYRRPDGIGVVPLGLLGP
jgi:hypothetical protein